MSITVNDLNDSVLVSLSEQLRDLQPVLEKQVELADVTSKLTQLATLLDGTHGIPANASLSAAMQHSTTKTDCASWRVSRRSRWWTSSPKPRSRHDPRRPAHAAAVGLLLLERRMVGWSGRSHCAAAGSLHAPGGRRDQCGDAVSPVGADDAGGATLWRETILGRRP